MTTETVKGYVYIDVDRDRDRDGDSNSGREGGGYRSMKKNHAGLTTIFEAFNADLTGTLVL